MPSQAGRREKHVGESDLEQGGKAFTGGAGGLREGLGTTLAFPVPRRSSFQSRHVGIIASFLLLMKIISFLLFISQYITIGKLVNWETLMVSNRCLCF